MSASALSPTSSLLRALPLATLLLACLLAGPAAAQEPAPTDNVAEAERLFDLGRKLMMEPGKLDESCETLRKSLELMERGDTYLNLAECHRRQGKTATAWREFGRALQHAKTVEFKEAIETAKEIRAGLEAKLSTLTVTVPPPMAKLKGLVVELNGEPLPSDQWGKAMVLDPQTYAITARAEGHQPFAKSVELGDDKDVKAVTVALDKTPPPPPSPEPAPTEPPKPKPEPAPTESSGGGIHPLTIIGFAVGGAGFIAYGVLGGLSIDKRGTFDDDCPDDLCPAGSEDDIDEAILFADLATVGLVTGIVGAAAGVAGLLFLSGGDDEDSVSLTLDLGPGAATLRGTF